jgi:hypothetical protein
MANSGTAGYIGGGTPSTGVLSRVDKLTFSNETRTTLGATLSQARKGVAAMANSGTAGYFAGGSDGSAYHVSSVIDKLTFSNDTVGVLSARSRSAMFQTGFANSGTL